MSEIKECDIASHNQTMAPKKEAVNVVSGHSNCQMETSKATFMDSVLVTVFIHIEGKWFPQWRSVFLLLKYTQIVSLEYRVKILS